MELSPEEKQRILEEKNAKLTKKAVKSGEGAKNIVSYLTLVIVLAGLIGALISMRSSGVSNRSSYRSSYVQPTIVVPRQIETANDWRNASREERLKFARRYIEIINRPGVLPSALVHCIDGAITGYRDTKPLTAMAACLLLSGQ